MLETLINTNQHNNCKAVCDLNVIAEYKNHAVRDRFLREFSMSEEEANEVFEETVKWLWLCAKSVKMPNAPRLAIDDHLLVIDKMWHTFLLFTHDYCNFCNEYFGFFVHHQPEANAIANENSELSESDKWEKEKARLVKQYKFIAENLGTATLRKWIKDFGNKYTPQNLSLLAHEAKPKLGGVEYTKGRSIDQALLISSELVKRGYFIAKDKVEQGEFLDICNTLGGVFECTNIQVQNDSKSFFGSANAMPFHTDSPRANIVAWHCEVESEDEPTLLVDGWDFVSSLSDEEREYMSRFELIIPGSKHSFPVLSVSSNGPKIYFAEWLCKDERIKNRFMQWFYELKSEQVISVGLKKGECLFVNNNRFLHGRNKLMVDTKRVLFRAWVS